MNGFTTVTDVNLRICLEMDYDTLINLFSINKYFNNLLLTNYDFWVRKFEYDGFLLRINTKVTKELIKEYKKVYKCSMMAYKIMIINNIEQNVKNHNTLGNIGLFYNYTNTFNKDNFVNMWNGVISVEFLEITLNIIHKLKNYSVTFVINNNTLTGSVVDLINNNEYTEKIQVNFNQIHKIICNGIYYNLRLNDTQFYVGLEFIILDEDFYKRRDVREAFYASRRVGYWQMLEDKELMHMMLDKVRNSFNDNYGC